MSWIESQMNANKDTWTQKAEGLTQQQTCVRSKSASQESLWECAKGRVTPPETSDPFVQTRVLPTCRFSPEKLQKQRTKTLMKPDICSIQEYSVNKSTTGTS